MAASWKLATAPLVCVDACWVSWYVLMRVGFVEDRVMAVALLRMLVVAARLYMLWYYWEDHNAV